MDIGYVARSGTLGAVKGILFSRSTSTRVCDRFLAWLARLAAVAAEGGPDST